MTQAGSDANVPPIDPATAGIDVGAYDSKSDYQAAVMEQYKLYVEMADNVSARRSTANTFFLTLNSAVFVAIGVFWKNPPAASSWLLAAPLLILILECYGWLAIINSYQKLNGGKFEVIRALEKLLPISPYDIEWARLGEGKDRSRYSPLTGVEKLIPIAFGMSYLAGAIALIATA